MVAVALLVWFVAVVLPPVVVVLLWASLLAASAPSCLSCWLVLVLFARVWLIEAQVLAPVPAVVPVV